MEWAGKRVAVLGLGVSNMALLRYLVRHGASITAYDRQTPDELGVTYRELVKMPVELRLGLEHHEMNDLHQFEKVFVTPGMPKHLQVLREAERRGTELSSEIQVLMERCPAKIIGITGSSGKTTTTALIGEILSAAGLRVHVGGNIGRPLIEIVDDIQSDDWVVLELSSFQLDRLKRSPHIGVITNITPNHLQEHGSMEAYIEAKAENVRWQQPHDWAILNWDDPIVKKFGHQVSSSVRFFSALETLKVGVFIQDERIVIARPDSLPVEVCRLEEVRLLGRHNVENVLAAVAAAEQTGVPIAAMREAIRQFEGVPHRLELVHDSWGVRYYNDSISTTPERAIAGIRSFNEPVVLIAGGYEKGLPFDGMAEAINERVKTLILIGDTAQAIEDAVVRTCADPSLLPEIIHAGSFETAVIKAIQAAVSGDVVLMSPGCASFGMFRNFTERGEAFRRLVGKHVNALRSPTQKVQ